MTNENIYTQLDQLSEVADNLDRENQRLYYDLDKLQLETREQQQLIDQLRKKNADLESMLSLRELFMKIMAAPSDGEYAQTGFEELRQQMVQNSQENQRLQQQVDRLSKLYAFVCEENKELLEELNADKPLEQEASDTADSYPRTRYQWVGGADGDLFQVEEESPRRVADNLDRENQRLQQQVDRLSKLYAFVCEENKELLEELNADKPFEQSEL